MRIYDWYKENIDPVYYAYGSLVFNGLYSLYNLFLGIYSASWTFIALFGYYALLGSLRFGVLMSSRKKGKDSLRQTFLMSFTGGMFIGLAATLGGIVYLSHVTGSGRKHHEIIMISIALYTTIKVVLAIRNLVKSRKREKLFMTTLRGISLADALVSILALQQSMLMTFEGMSDGEEKLLNLITGSVVTLLIFILGIILLIGGRHFAKIKSSSN